MTSVAITSEGVFLSAKVCSLIRYPLLSDLAEAHREARRDGVVVAPEIVDAITLIDNVGAWFQERRVADVSSEVSSVASRGCADVDFEVMTVPAAAHELKVSQQFTRRLLAHQILHGEQQADRSWRVCSDSVTKRLEGKKCRHLIEGVPLP